MMRTQRPCSATKVNNKWRIKNAHLRGLKNEIECAALLLGICFLGNSFAFHLDSIDYLCLIWTNRTYFNFLVYFSIKATMVIAPVNCAIVPTSSSSSLLIPILCIFYLHSEKKGITPAKRWGRRKEFTVTAGYVALHDSTSVFSR